MYEPITEAEIIGLDHVWHELVLSAQKMNEDLWQCGLEGISTIEISILSIIERKPDVILKEIIEVLGIPGSTLTSAIDRLEKRGLIRRAISQRDRRSFGLELTPQGQKAQQEHRENEKKLWAQILGAFETSGDRREFTRLLRILADNLPGGMKGGVPDER